MAASEAFMEGLDNLISYFRKEFNLTYGEIIGVLEVEKLMLFSEMESLADEEEDEE